MDLGDKIKQLRIERHMTLEELGNRVGVGKSTVRKWETGDIANMRRDKIALIANALGVSPAYLMGWTDINGVRSNKTEETRNEDLNKVIDLVDRLPPDKVDLAVRLLQALLEQK